jgi:hypothetical protein
VLDRLYCRDGQSLLNDVRVALGLVPFRSGFEQYDRAARVDAGEFLLRFSGQAASCQHAACRNTNRGLRGARVAISMVFEREARRPLVVVSLSTLEQGQASLLQRILLALGQLNVHGLVTLGPALDPGQFAAPPNVLLERSSRIRRCSRMPMCS